MTRLASLTLGALLLAVPAAASAGDYRVGGVEVRHPWTRPAQAGMNGVGYLTLANVGAKPMKLVAAESPAARTVSIHQTLQVNGVSSMRAVAGGLSVAPGAKVEFAPGGYHLMLIGLTRAQAPGGKTPVTLVFEGGQKVRIDLSVETGGPKPGAMGGMAMGH